MAEHSNTPLSPPARETREEEADRALRHTRFTPGSMAMLIALFLATLVSTPLVQIVVEIQQNRREREEARAQRMPMPSFQPQAGEILRLLPTPDEIRAVRDLSGALALLPPVSEIRAYETALEERSVLSAWTLPTVQSLLAGGLGVGNEQAYVGQEGWLFYRPDIEYLTGRGFLDLTHLAPQLDGRSDPRQVDPIKALQRFQEQLAQRGIRLIVVPVPLKPMAHPEQLSRRYPVGAPTREWLQNPSYPRFVRKMQQAGIEVFDVSALLSGAPGAQYLKTDTHWTPEVMERTAAALAQYLKASGAMAATSDTRYIRRITDITNDGDIVAMLKLPADQTLFPRQQVRIHPVATADSRRPWQAHRDAEILLLGDSFSNIYSLGAMGWGENAGFAEQISYYLQSPLDTICVNAGGASATRQKLVQELRRGNDRLRGKRIVIYEFAMRDLAAGDWKLLDLPEIAPISPPAR